PRGRAPAGADGHGETQLVARAAIAAKGSTTVAEAMAAVLEAVCDDAGWSVGRLHVAGPNGLIATSTWYLADPERHAALLRTTESTAAGLGAGLPARVVGSRRPAWVADIRTEPGLPLAEHLLGLGMQACFAFPVL